MKLYSAPDPAPNPRRVLIFLGEKNLNITIENVSILKGEQKAETFLAKNSRGQIPVLELDDGSHICESISICRYLDELHPSPPLFGTNPLERALVDMWVRRIEFHLMQPVSQYWAHAHPFTARVVKQFKDYGQSNQERWVAAAHWLNRELKKGAYIAGSSFTIADIATLTCVDFAVWIGLAMPTECKNLIAWHANVSNRPSVQRLKRT